MSRTYSGCQSAQNLSGRGREFHSVAKISLWESQHDLINEMFCWVESCDFVFQCYETQYKKNKTGFSKCEVSFIFFLKKIEVDNFLKSFPQRMKNKMRLESFNIEIYNYYQKDRVVSKHPNTP